MSVPSPAFLRQAERNLPRYTSYPTALAFEPAPGGGAAVAPWLQAMRAEDPVSVYVHVPFCRRLCWYCGCHTTVAHGYERVAAFQARLSREVDLWAGAVGAHAGAAHLHFGGGSPNALSPEHFVALVRRIANRFGLRPGAEIAVELDPGVLTDAFSDACGEAGVTRASLGVQTLDPEVQRKVNRVQPFERVAAGVSRLRAAGVAAVNFDLMYGLPGQTPESVFESARQALTLRPDRVAVFGYAHVPWMKKHQQMIAEHELAGAVDRWAQAEAADTALLDAGYVRIGLDHYALPDDPLAIARRGGRLRRNFQGYTDDPAPVLIPVGPSSIGQFRDGFVQNAVATDVWGREVNAGRLPVARVLPVDDEDRLRAAAIERIMCDLKLDAGALCRELGRSEDSLDEALDALAPAERDGLCRVSGREVAMSPDAFRLVRAVAAAFDARLPAEPKRHARAV